MIVTIASGKSNQRQETIEKVDRVIADLVCYTCADDLMDWVEKAHRLAAGEYAVLIPEDGGIEFPHEGYAVELRMADGTTEYRLVQADVFVMNDNGKTIHSYRFPSRLSEQLLRTIMDDVTRWFQSNLMDEEIGAEARQYLTGMRVPRSSWEELRLGYAPRGWQKLLSNFIQKYGEKSLLELDLVVKQVDKDSLYDKFRDKVIYPVTDKQNRVVRFIGQPIGRGVIIESKEHESFKEKSK